MAIFNSLIQTLNKIPYYKTTKNLSVARTNFAAATVGNYALFAGGTIKEGNVSTENLKNTVDAYNQTLTHLLPDTLHTLNVNLVVTTLNNCAMFNGYYSNCLDIYDSSLTHTYITNMGKFHNGGATTVGNYALFAGGSGVYSPQDIVYAFDSSFTKSVLSSLSKPRAELAAASVGNYALFAGGRKGNSSTYKSTGYSLVDTYNETLTRGSADNLKYNRYALVAAVVNKYALFAGGEEVGTNYDFHISDVEVYDSSLTHSFINDLSEARYNLSATTLGNYALFAGGRGNTSSIAAMEAYDKNLVQTILPDLPEKRQSLAATTIKKYALFGGGSVDSSTASSDEIFVYSIE